MNDTWEFERDPLAALSRGDDGPFEAFVVSETPLFLSFFQRLGASTAEAEDLVQDLFLKLFQSAPNYVREGRFEAFAFRIARNAWIDRRRRAAVQPRRVPREGDERGGETRDRLNVASTGRPGPEISEPIVDVSRREEAGRLRAALQQLSDSHRLVFELGVIQELPYSEISEALEIPVGTVKSRMYHAVRKLRSALGVEDDVAGEESA